MKIGIYSGAFDPVHEGHLAFARQSIKNCGLEKVYFLPEKFPRDKPNVSKLSNRIFELENCLKNENKLEILTLEDDFFTPKKTLPKLEKLFPNSQLTFLIGSDVAKRLSSWQDTKTMFENHAFAVCMRSSCQKSEVEKEINNLPVKLNYCQVKSKKAHLTSSKIRRKYGP